MLNGRIVEYNVKIRRMVLSAFTFDNFMTLSLAIGTLFLIAATIRMKFFDKGKDDHLDQQIKEISTIVDKQQEETKKSSFNTFFEISKGLLTSQAGSLDFDELYKIYSEKFQTKKEEDKILPLVEGLINNYHKQALRQASIQFWFSLCAAVAGFFFILNGLIFSPELSASDKAISTIPGIIVDLVAALFFKQAEQTRQRATDLYDRLRFDNERKEAITLIDSIENENLRSIVKAQLALKIGGVESTINDLSTLTRTSSK